MTSALLPKAACRDALCRALLLCHSGSHRLLAVPVGLGGQPSRTTTRLELLEMFPLLGWWGQGSLSTQDEAGEGLLVLEVQMM